MSFFESIGMADMEKVHSQTIAWFFSKDCDAMSPRGKEKILSSMLSGAEIATIQNVYTEYKSIDIVIETDRHVIAIENKIKSNQHSNQLERYKTTLCNDFEGKEKAYLFLTLVAEVPKSSEWRNISYQVLSDEMDVQYKAYGRGDKTDGVIFVDYLNTIKALGFVVKSFEMDHRRFKNVFTDGGLKKHEKIKKSRIQGYNEEQKYVQNNQLETLLQKQFFSRINRVFSEKTGVIGRIDETRGNALIHFTIGKFKYEGRWFEMGYQIQGNTVKFNFQAEIYQTSKEAWITQAMIEKMVELKRILAYKRMNKPRTHAYLSISKKMPKKIWEYECEEVLEYWLLDYYEILAHKENLIIYFEKLND